MRLYVFIFTYIYIIYSNNMFFPIGIFIVAAKRTPFGTMGGVFSNKSATDLSVVAAKSALQSAKLNPDNIDSVVFGHVLAVCS